MTTLSGCVFSKHLRVTAAQPACVLWTGPDIHIDLMKAKTDETQITTHHLQKLSDWFGGNETPPLDPCGLRTHHQGLLWKSAVRHNVHKNCEMLGWFCFNVEWQLNRKFAFSYVVRKYLSGTTVQNSLRQSTWNKFQCQDGPTINPSWISSPYWHTVYFYAPGKTSPECDWLCSAPDYRSDTSSLHRPSN